MLENEKRNNNFDENTDGQQEDIFAEGDVSIPEDDMKCGTDSKVDAGCDADASAQQAGADVSGQKIEEAETRQAQPEHEKSYEQQFKERRAAEPNPYSYETDDESSSDKVKDFSKESKKRAAKEKKHRKHMNHYAKAICCAILCGVIVGGCVLGSFMIGSNVSKSSAEVTTNNAKLSATTTSSSDSEETASSGTEYTVSQIAANCGSSVVAITNKSVSEVQTMFGVYQQESEGSGSGVIVSQTDSELLIVTNYHVIENAEELSVCFNDSEDSVFSAQVKGTDSDNDLAVIAIQLSDISDDVLNSISIATIGDSDSLEVGDGVVAIGNALGLGQSTTAGIVSALNREVTIDNTTSVLLQTDAAINPGNSGGALFNMKGELVAINSAKYASEEVEGMGFAIPMSTAQPIIESLMTKETRTKLTSDYGCLNISATSVSSDVSEMYGIPEGVYVYSVLDGKAAANAGIQEGDIITSIDGNTVSTIDDLKEELQYYAAGETVEVVLQRNGSNGYEKQTVTVTLDNASEQDSSDFESSTSGQSGQSSQGSQGQSGSMDNGFSFK